MTQKSLVYEQPVSELVRAYLRLEYLFKHLHKRVEHYTKHDPQFTMQLLIEIIRVLDRPDLKSKLTQEVHRLIAVLKKLKEAPGVKQALLVKKLEALEKLLSRLSGVSGKLGHHLEHFDFLSTVRLNLNTAGNGCCTDTPLYYYWLEQDTQKQQQQFKHWVSQLGLVHDVTEALLTIVRGSADNRLLTAENGFYHENLPSSPSCQLLRIALPKTAAVYPEISAGKHRFTLRFLEASLDQTPQSKNDIAFELQICSI